MSANPLAPGWYLELDHDEAAFVSAGLTCLMAQIGRRPEYVVLMACVTSAFNQLGAERVDLLLGKLAAHLRATPPGEGGPGG